MIIIVISSAFLSSLLFSITFCLWAFSWIRISGRIFSISEIFIIWRWDLLLFSCARGIRFWGLTFHHVAAAIYILVPYFWRLKTVFLLILCLFFRYFHADRSLLANYGSENTDVWPRLNYIMSASIAILYLFPAIPKLLIEAFSHTIPSITCIQLYSALSAPPRIF